MKLKPSSVALLVIALVLAASSALVARNLLRPSAASSKEVVVKEEPKPEPSFVLTAAHTITPGEFIDQSAVRWNERPASDIHVGDIVGRNPSERRELEQGLFGSTVSKTIEDGDTILDNMLLYPGSPGFIPAVLSPGMRAISIPTSAVTSNAGLVSAGDWVDVILSVERDEAAIMSSQSGNLAQANLAAQTILQKVRVLALNSDTNSLAPTPNLRTSDQSPKEAKKSRRKAYETITLEVMPEAAERLAVAREAGSLQVVLRSVKDDDIVVADAGGEDQEKVTRIQDATAIFIPSTKGAASPMVQVFHGRKATTVKYGN